MHRSKGFTPAKGNAFTLIELLVVIAIIAILAAILFPVFAQARAKARQTACLSNMKQIGTGMLMYTQDYDEAVPYVWFGGGGGGTSATGNYKWMDAIYPYIKSDAIFNCPDAVYPHAVGNDRYYKYVNRQNLAAQTPAPAGNNVETGNFYYGSYGYNAVYRNDAASANRTPPSGGYGGGQSTAAFQSPATTVWIVDGVNYYFGWPLLARQPNPIILATASPKRTNGALNENMVARHAERTNVIYCDGHVKSESMDSLVQNRRSDGTMINFIIQAQ